MTNIYRVSRSVVEKWPTLLQSRKLLDLSLSGGLRFSWQGYRPANSTLTLLLIFFIYLLIFYFIFLIIIIHYNKNETKNPITCLKLVICGLRQKFSHCVGIPLYCEKVLYPPPLSHFNKNKNKILFFQSVSR